MCLSKFIFLILLLFIGDFSTNSYANIVHFSPCTIDTNYPVDRKKVIKKKKRNRNKKVQRKALLKIQKQQDSTIEVIGFVGLFLLLLLPFFLLIVGILTGGLGWLVAGFITLGLWIISGYISILSQLTIPPFLGVAICIFFSMACIALIIWGAIVILEPILIALSLSISLLFILHLIFLFLQKSNKTDDEYY